MSFFIEQLRWVECEMKETVTEGCAQPRIIFRLTSFVISYAKWHFGIKGYASKDTGDCAHLLLAIRTFNMRA